MSLLKIEIDASFGRWQNYSGVSSPGNAAAKAAIAASNLAKSVMNRHFINTKLALLEPQIIDLRRTNAGVLIAISELNCGGGDQKFSKVDEVTIVGAGSSPFAAFQQSRPAWHAACAVGTTTRNTFYFWYSSFGVSWYSARAIMDTQEFHKFQEFNRRLRQGASVDELCTAY